MTLGREIEKIRCERNIPVWYMCNIFGILTEMEYEDIIHNRVKLTPYQIISFITVFRCPLSSL
ncbi:MAG: hypothetical protein J6J82_01245 [Alphaproteobacteria bacterium]|nr:hypothetical protein [Alphaproteobacteria bacterium]